MNSRRPSTIECATLSGNVECVKYFFLLPPSNHFSLVYQIRTAAETAIRLRALPPDQQQRSSTEYVFSNMKIEESTPAQMTAEYIRFSLLPGAASSGSVPLLTYLLEQLRLLMVNGTTVWNIFILTSI